MKNTLDLNTRLTYKFNTSMTLTDKMTLIKKSEKLFFLWDLCDIEIEVICPEHDSHWYKFTVYSNNGIFKFSYSDNLLFSDTENHTLLVNQFGDNYLNQACPMILQAINTKEQNGDKTTLTDCLMMINLFKRMYTMDLLR